MLKVFLEALDEAPHKVPMRDGLAGRFRQVVGNVVHAGTRKIRRSSPGVSFAEFRPNATTAGGCSGRCRRRGLRRGRGRARRGSGAADGHSRGRGWCGRGWCRGHWATAGTAKALIAVGQVGHFVGGFFSRFLCNDCGSGWEAGFLFKKELSLQTASAGCYQCTERKTFLFPYLYHGDVMVQIHLFIFILTRIHRGWIWKKRQRKKKSLEGAFK